MERQSKYILDDGTVGYFELGNTPIANFSTSGSATSSVVINTKSVVKSKIKSIVFGESYRVTTTLPANFLSMFTELEYTDLAPFINIQTIGTNCFGNLKLKSIDLSPLEKLRTIGAGFLKNNENLKTLDISVLPSITSIGDNFCYGCTKLVDINIGELDFKSKVIGTNALSGGVFNGNNCVVRAKTLELAEEFIKKCPSISNWSVSPILVPKRNWILKIFKSFNFMGNKIYNARVDDPKLNEHIVNKRTLVRETTYDTTLVQRFRKPFRFPWTQVEFYGLRIKRVLDELLFPRIPYQYTNPKLEVIDFCSNISNNAYNIIDDLGENEPKGTRPKFQLFYDTNNFAFKLKFKINQHDRPSVGQAKILIYNPTDQLVGNFTATNTNDSGTIYVQNQIFREGYKIIFEKQYNASPIKNDTHGEPSPENGFTDLGYLYREDITAQFYDRFYLQHSPIIRLKTGTDGLATDVVSGSANPPAGFTYNYTYRIGSGAECLFDILIPHDADINPSKYNMEINIRTSVDVNNQNDKILHTIKLGDILKQLHCNSTKYIINGITYRLGYINLGIFDTHPVRVDFILKPY